MEPKRSALVVASYEYEDSGLRQLRAPSHDAEALTRVLGDDEIGSFDVDVSVNEPQHVVLRKVSRFFAERSLDDLLLLHFSCHGIKDDDGNLYFATTDTDIHHLDATAVPSDFVNRLMERSRSRRIALFLDCCYSGAFSRGARARAGDKVDLADRLGGRGQVVITASNAMEYAFEGDELTGEGRPSVFTAALVDALETGAADRDADGLISVDELYDYVYEEVRRKTPNQSPHKWADVTGDLFIARNPRPIVEPAELPEHIRAAMENLSAAIRAGAVEDLGRLLGSSQRRVALAARLALKELVDDDSRRVSSAVQALLEEQQAAETDDAPPLEQAREPAGQPLPAHEPPPAQEPEDAGAVEPSRKVGVAQATERPVPKAEAAAVETAAPARGPEADAARTIRNASVVTVIGAVDTLVGWIAYWLGGEWDGVAGIDYFAIQAIAVPLLVALAATTTFRRRGDSRVAFGFILAVGILTTGAYWGILGWNLHNDDFREAQAVILLGAILILVGGIMGLRGLRGGQEDTPSAADFPRTARFVSRLGFLGAGLGVISLFVPWGSIATGYYSYAENTRVVDLDAKELMLLHLEAIVSVIAVAVVSTLLWRSSSVNGPTFVGLLVGFGLQATLFWVGGLWFVVGWGFLGGAEAQAWSPRLGLAFGLAGGAIVFAAGVVLWRRIRSPRPATASRVAPLPQ